MIDLSPTIAAKSNQLNADDLLGGAITVKITNVSKVEGEQPVAISYEGDNGKPFMPCKSMRRVLIGIWGRDGNQYVGRSLTLYRDATVTFGGQAVGGIRISHMSNITAPVTLSLTATKKSKKPFTVKPLAAAPVSAPSAPPQTDAERSAKAEAAKQKLLAELAAITAPDALAAFMQAGAATMKRLHDAYADKYDEIMAAVTAKEESFNAGSEF